MANMAPVSFEECSKPGVLHFTPLIYAYKYEWYWAPAVVDDFGTARPIDTGKARAFYFEDRHDRH